MLAPSSILTTTAWKTLSSAARSTLLYLYVRSDAAGRCWPSVNKIAEDMRLDRRTVMRATEELDEGGLVERQITPGKITHYKIKPVSNGTPVCEMQGTGVRNDTAPVSNGTPEQSKEQTKEQNKPYHLFAEKLKTKIIEAGSQAKLNGKQTTAWANDFRLIVEQDKRTSENITAMIEAVFKDSFWKNQIRSAGSLREKWNEGKLDRLNVSATPAASVPLAHRPLNVGAAR